ncbi:SDR family oxidoreductase [Shewanella hanedai]|uniref:SDR family oxidoreductase n=1 Tax=Shewanella hanedai TaxID=25 RepID=A0A553JTG2_SHEHA|nr:SDR family oxidoreductase [Shewanella hanedai]
MRKVRKRLDRFSNSFKKIVPVNIPIYHNQLLKGRVAIVTGGTSGIGFEIASSFLRSGASVVITGRDKSRIKGAIEKILTSDNNNNGRIYGVVLDNSNIGAFESAFNEIIAFLGDKEIDILVNNAGVLKGGQFSHITSEEYDEVLDTNLKGVFFLSQLISKYMVENNIKGNILNIASSSSLRPAISPYTLSKWGLRGLTLGMAKTLAPQGIVVNGLAPGPTATPMLMKDSDDGIEHYVIPSQRYVTPEEVANFAVILVSSLSRSIIGDVVYMTGGAGNLTIDDIDYNF